MSGVKVKDFNVLFMDNVADVLKNALNEVIGLIDSSEHIYSRNKIDKLLNDLKNKKLEIRVEAVSNSSKHVANDIDKVSYSYGYVDFGKESIIYNGVTKKKIVVWKELLKDIDDLYLQKVLAFLLDWYLSIDEKAILSNYLNFSDTIKRNPIFEYTMLTDLENNRPIGGFRLSILDKWCGFYSIAISDIVSSLLIKQSYFFKRRSKFLMALLNINNQDIYYFLKKREASDIKYFYSLIPEEYIKQIGLRGIIYENANKENFASYQLRKFNMEIWIYKYISFLYYSGIMDNHNEEKKEEYISELLQFCNTFYNPDTKLDFRDEIK